MLAERLETHYLSNPDPSLRFALLTDFTDAQNETMPQDDELVQDALERIRILNDRYREADDDRAGAVGDNQAHTDGNGQAHAGGEARPAVESDRFFLFHRRRLRNASQGCWMGWERKRGKLLEFNRLLRGARDTSYSVLSADPSSLPRIRYVITLDADTRMPRDAAGRLVGSMAHALNRPRLDPAAKRVVAGYGVLQPRISFHLTAATRSRFAALLATSGGIDPYSTAASDAYMDLFGVGTFTGKGIYDVDAFEAATGETFPENHVLSHDLIEGNYARCGLLTDTELFDDFPARYNAYARREHRWVRGDWQLLPWLGLRVPVAGSGRVGGPFEPDTEEDRPPASWPGGYLLREGGAPSEPDTEEARPLGPPLVPLARSRNPLPVLERWKLLDNLRRSLVPPALLLLLVLGWTVLPGSPWAWTAVALVVFLLPLIQAALSIAIGGIRSKSLSPLRKSRETLPAVLGQIGMDIVFLASRSFVLFDAIVRTLARLFVSRRKLLEWETAASTEQRLGTNLEHFIKGMWPGPALAIEILVLVGIVRPRGAGRGVALPGRVAPLPRGGLLPQPARRGGPHGAERLRAPGAAAGRAQDLAVLRDVRRRRRPLAPARQLPGDPRRPDRPPDLADQHGALLLSSLSASDLGYIGPRRLVERLEKTLETLKGLERHWGHFYNWYQTETLQPLPPKYVSTVDSGNLLGCLIALGHGLREKAVTPLADATGIPTALQGLADTFGLAAEETSGDALRKLRSLIEEPEHHLIWWDGWLEKVERAAREVGEAPGTAGVGLRTDTLDVGRPAGRSGRRMAGRTE